MSIKVAIAGARGKMGVEAVHTVMKNDGMELVAVLDYKDVGQTLATLELFPNHYEVPIYTDFEQLVADTKPDVFVDLTNPHFVYEHTKQALLNSVRPVIGTTGFTDDQLQELTNLSVEKGIGCIVAPNFAIGAILMMKFAKEAAKYFPDVEIIEMHHDQKLDAPSGTGLKTAQMISEVRATKQQGHLDEKETHAGARGANYDGMHIHSVRLPGLVAHQQVLFGGTGELLTIRHDSFNRGSFMGGIAFCIVEVMKRETLVYGLENII
ncbi:4-hydroxy-tetrahydrodipicolinate reductase [Lysinibacillus sp. 2017]|uniref:4-hydroxy-tetrahydrodipicolinate reductase n=1 Tax=unclassified Lysinibacillus TaxID=2636778 RepID=UPI000D526EDF|nr:MULTISPECIES: 4-hydroxy-tetrahydrodipicolinate reductase [unclassified Lysinibacillus]AWE07009.1 4-hydroxy-tetrahydrodipicolinate reductase [Lysinibacillus sp. 2017]TGN37067.1 4-hydroxy-tetrahydrodipicolinate reductase [Lysinibacillus sp. S2017]